MPDDVDFILRHSCEVAEDLRALIAAARAEENEACAQIAEREDTHERDKTEWTVDCIEKSACDRLALEIALAIRSRMVTK